jgi:hypothetical protein
MKHLFVLFIGIMALSSCDEDFEEAKFRCKINNDEFVASDDLTVVTVSGNGNDFYIQASRVANPLSSDLYGEVKLDFTATATGMIELDAINTWRWSNNGDQTFRSDNNNPGTLNITTLDVAGKSIAGTFELTAVNDGGTATKNVTEGFFDLTW